MKALVAVLVVAVIALFVLAHEQRAELTAMRAEMVDRDKAQSTGHEGQFKILIEHAGELHEIRDYAAALAVRLDKQFAQIITVLDRQVADERKLGLIH